MNRRTIVSVGVASALAFGAGALGAGKPATGRTTMDQDKGMDLGTFSVSLAVKDLGASRAFYEALGFRQIGGNPDQNWLILQNGASTIGLFQGMFEDNIMTFNPGWSAAFKAKESFEDIRSIQERLKAAGLEPLVEADPASTGPAHLVLADPDGNQVMLDQHVNKPGG